MVTAETDETAARAQRASVPTAATRRQPVLAPLGPPRLLESTVQQDAATEAASAAFEVEFSGKATFQHSPLKSPDWPWRIALYYGPSGTGKSLLLAEQTGSERVGAAPSTAAMAWLTPGFLSNCIHWVRSVESRGIYPWGLGVRVVPQHRV